MTSPKKICYRKDLIILRSVPKMEGAVKVDSGPQKAVSPLDGFLI